MNIIIDEKLHLDLVKRCMFMLEVGSELYGFKSDESDRDVLTIYIMNEKESISLLNNTFYTLQYREEVNAFGKFFGVKTDYLHNSLQGFFRNVLEGGSTICFEAMHTKLFRQTFEDLDIKNFYNYNIVKAYLGLVKRDLERLHKLSSLYDKRKCLSHAYRGFIFAREILEGRTLRLKIDEYDEMVINNFKSIRDMNRNWEQGDDDVADFIYDKAMELRERATTKMQNGDLVRYMDPLKHRDLDDYLFSMLKNPPFIIDLSNNLDLQPIRDVLENGVK